MSAYVDQWTLPLLAFGVGLLLGYYMGYPIGWLTGFDFKDRIVKAREEKC